MCCIIRATAIWHIPFYIVKSNLVYFRVISISYISSSSSTWFNKRIDRGNELGLEINHFRAWLVAISVQMVRGKCFNCYVV